ncbi:hypothetical protein GCM10007874_44870 [Labrys miyagiensis]|uniref:Uncharacterized protein n=1 Tax=Labrys miyagiensis TaxID=346912 RepID=A0ABQ6CMX7_9HYPH|nr:hypothetical protein GCM10007874_44870 [Labrys miyagiensis]
MTYRSGFWLAQHASDEKCEARAFICSAAHHSDRASNNVLGDRKSLRDKDRYHIDGTSHTAPDIGRHHIPEPPAQRGRMRPNPGAPQEIRRTLAMLPSVKTQSLL